MIGIRPARPEDIGAITAIYNEAVLHTTGTFDTVPKTEADRRQWFDHHGERHPILVATREERVIGYACLSEFSDRAAYDTTAEVSLYLLNEFHQQGIGSRLLAALVESARGVGLHSLVSRISEGNDASFRLHRKFGFEEAGRLREAGKKFGRLLDVHYWQLILP